MTTYRYSGRHVTARRKRWPVVLATVAALLVAGALVGTQAARSAVDSLLRTVRGASCTAATNDGAVTLSAEQMGNAAIIASVGTVRGFPARAVTIALATALQESHLRNLDHGDRDSLGLFQQRPSAGWGTAQEIRDPVTAAGNFYEALSKFGDYSAVPLADAAQGVQHSAYPEEYAKHEPDASVLTGALVGAAPAAVRCSLPSGGGGGSAQGGASTAVREALQREVGVSAQDGGSAIAVPAGAHGWAIAHWAVARADALRISEVTFAGRTWTAAGGDWTTARAARTSTVRIAVQD